MKVIVDPLQCACSGYCVRLAPTVFDWLPDDSAAFVRSQPGDDTERQVAIEAVQVCPTRAITVTEDIDEDKHD
jgi:ferredoxin